MNNKPKKISEIITEKGAQTLLDGYTDFGTDAALTDDEQQRILSSAMRKAGFEMKDPMTMKKTRKHSKRFIAFVAAAALMTTAAIGAGAYGIYVNHRQSVDRYLGDSAADTLEQQGLLDGSEIAATEHYKITQETVLSTGNVTSIIVTLEGIDDESKELLNSKTKSLELDFPAVISATNGKVESSSTFPIYGEGYITCLYDVICKDLYEPVNADIGLYLCNKRIEGGIEGEVRDGEYMGNINFTTEPNVEGIQFVGENNNKSFRLYDFCLTSDDHIPVEGDPKKTETISQNVIIEYEDDRTDTLDGQDLNYTDHAGHEGVTVLTDLETQTNTRAVFRRLIDSANVSAVTINGERYVRQ